MTPTEAGKIVKLVLSAYPTQRQKFSDEDTRAMTATYIAQLGDLPFDATMAAAGRLVNTSKWMPSVADIRGSVVLVRDGALRDGGEAYDDIRKAIGRYGRDRVPGKDFEFADPIVAKVVDALGWKELCNSTDQTADRARTMDTYERMRDREQADQIAGTTTTKRLGGATPKRIAGPEAKGLGDLIKGLLPNGENEDDAEDDE